MSTDSGRDKGIMRCVRVSDRKHNYGEQNAMNRSVTKRCVFYRLLIETVLLLCFMVLCFVDTTKAEEADQIDPMEELGYTFHNVNAAAKATRIIFVQILCFSECLLHNISRFSAVWTNFNSILLNNMSVMTIVPRLHPL